MIFGDNRWLEGLFLSQFPFDAALCRMVFKNHTVRKSAHTVGALKMLF